MGSLVLKRAEVGEKQSRRDALQFRKLFLAKLLSIEFGPFGDSCVASWCIHVFANESVMAQMSLIGVSSSRSEKNEVSRNALSFTCVRPTVSLQSFILCKICNELYLNF